MQSLARMEYDARQVEMIDAAKAVSMVDGILARDYLSAQAINSEPNIPLRNAMVHISRLAMSGHVVAARMAVREMAATGDYSKTPFLLLSRFINGATEPVGHDELLETVFDQYDRESKRYSGWPEKQRQCAADALLAAVYDDGLGYRQGLNCAGSMTNRQHIEHSAQRLRMFMVKLRKAYPNEN